MGAFYSLPSDLNQENFLEAISRLDEDSLGLHTFKFKDIPIGSVILWGQENRLEPHVVWFPWASPRNKLESSLHFLNEIRRDYFAMVFSAEETTPFFTHICKYGVLRRGCKVISYFPDNTDAMMFYINKK